MNTKELDTPELNWSSIKSQLLALNVLCIYNGTESLFDMLYTLRETLYPPT